MIQQPITMTSKGTFTLPAHIRKDLGLKKIGDKLMLTYHREAKTVELSGATDFEDLRNRLRPLAQASEPFDLKKARAEHHAETYRRHIS